MFEYRGAQIISETVFENTTPSLAKQVAHSLQNTRVVCESSDGFTASEKPAESVYLDGRMIAGLYSAGNPECLGTSISPPIRVLANNDVPTGAAYIKYVLHPDPSWNGWHAVNTYQARLPDSMRLRTLATESHSHSSNETDYGHQEGTARRMQDYTA